MVSTLPYPSYSTATGFKESLETERASRISTGTVRAGLSPSDTPDAVELQVHPDGKVVMRLSYPNLEPPELELRAASLDGTLSVLLARNTRKVLEVHCSSALSRLLTRGPFIEPSMISDWISGLPAHAYKTSLRSALLAEFLLKQMPGSLRKDLIAALNEER